MIDYYKLAFQNYANFSGRSSRSEYWWFVLCNLLVFLALYVLIFIGAAVESPIISMICGFGVLIYALAVFIPSLAVLVRRLHDVGKSGWFYFISLIPLVGPIILLVNLVKESDPHKNSWGSVPGNEYGDSLKDTLVDYDRDIV